MVFGRSGSLNGSFLCKRRELFAVLRKNSLEREDRDRLVGVARERVPEFRIAGSNAAFPTTHH